MSDRRDKETKKHCYTHLPAAPYSSQGGELKTGDKFPSDAGAFRTLRGGVSRSDGVGLFFFLSFLLSSLSFLRRHFFVIPAKAFFCHSCEGRNRV